MDFFHFGPHEDLFGSYAPSSGQGAPTEVVVLCYPFGQEYMRAHRAFRQVAVLLSRRGVPVFRFDYAGTGDSGGRGEDSRLSRWVDDCEAAIDEARRRSGAKRVRVAGLRLGAAIAAMASQGRDDVEVLALWDPVVSGTTFVADLEGSAQRRGRDLWWVHGFPVSSPLRGDFESMDLRSVHVPDNTRIVQMVSHSSQEFDRYSEALAGHGGGAETRLVPSPSDWNYSDDVGGILIPRDMVRALVDVLGA